MISKMAMVAWLVLCFAVSCGECEQPVLARPYDVAGRCFGEPVQVGCVAAGRSCPPNIKVGFDGSGRCFSFPGCLPDGFTQDVAGVKCQAEGFRECARVVTSLPGQVMAPDGSGGRRSLSHRR